MGCRTAPLFTARREIIVAIVRNEPGICVRAIALLVGIDATTAEYHVRRLERAGVVLRRRRGRSLALFLTGVSP